MNTPTPTTPANHPDPQGALVLAMAQSLISAANERPGPPHLAPIKPDLAKLLRDHDTQQPLFRQPATAA